MKSTGPWTVTLIIAINILIFVGWNWSEDPEFFMQNFLVSWTALVDGRYWVLLTSAFSHNWSLHIFVNMFVLWSFGGIMERLLGASFFIKFYLCAAVISSFAHAAVSAWILEQPELPALGASGAVAGVILLFSLVFPKEKIMLLGLIPLPAIFGALAFVALDLWGLMAQAGGGGLPIGHGAHLGGALTGLLAYIFVLRPRIQRARRLSVTQRVEEGEAGVSHPYD